MRWDQVRNRRASAIARGGVLAGFALVLSACGSHEPRREALVYEGGAVMGESMGETAYYTIVTVDDLDSEMAKKTVIKLADGVPVMLTQATPEFLIKRGRVFVAGEEKGSFTEVNGLSKFDPAIDYSVIVGPTPDGPYFRFDVKKGKAVTFGTQWIAAPLEDGVSFRPRPVFLDERGIAHPLPLDRKGVEELWGPPEKVEH